MDEHVRHDLSAYLDDALPADRAGAVRLHVADCGSCRSDLAQLRETARLLAALPAAVPSRRLVPSLAPRFNWLRPLRSLSAVGAATFLFLFMASATLDTGFRMGGGKAGVGAPANAPGPAVGAQPAGGAAGERTTLQASPTAVPPALDAATSSRAASTPAEQKAFTAATPSAATQESARNAAGGTDTQAGPRAPDASRYADAEPPQIGPTPWLWLALMLVSAAIALVAHRRLRTR